MIYYSKKWETVLDGITGKQSKLLVMKVCENYSSISINSLVAAQTQTSNMNFHFNASSDWVGWPLSCSIEIN